MHGVEEKHFLKRFCVCVFELKVLKLGDVPNGQYSKTE